MEVQVQEQRRFKQKIHNSHAHHLQLFNTLLQGCSPAPIPSRGTAGHRHGWLHMRPEVLVLKGGTDDSHDGAAGARAGSGRSGVDSIAAEGRGGKTAGSDGESGSRRHEGREEHDRRLVHRCAW